MECRFLVLHSIGVQGKDSSTENYFAYWFCLEVPQGFLIMLPFSSQFVKNSYALQKWRDIGNYFVILIVHWMKNQTLQDGLLQSVKEALERKDQGIDILVSSLRVKSLAKGLHSKNKLKEAKLISIALLSITRYNIQFKQSLCSLAVIFCTMSQLCLFLFISIWSPSFK